MMNDLFEELEGHPAGTVLEVTTFEGDRFRIKAEGQTWRDWLPVEGSPAPAHLQPNLGISSSPAYSVRALVTWTRAGYLVDFRVVSEATREAHPAGKARTAHEVAGDPMGGSR